MLDFISRYISAISLAAVVALSVFNIGYFWKIGLHFIGLIDATNIVYSFALSQIALFVWIIAAKVVIIDSRSTARLIVLGGIGAALSGWGIWHVSPRTLEPEFFENGAILMGFALAGAAYLGHILIRYPTHGLRDWRDVGALTFVAFAMVFQAGSFAASVEMSDRKRYAISTKAGVITDARILRSSSAGYILSVEKEVVFIPQGEIRSVRTLPDKY